MTVPRTTRRSPRRGVALALAGLLAASAAISLGTPAGAQRPPKPESTSPRAELAIAAAAVGGEVSNDPPGDPVTFVGTPPGGSLPVDGGGTTPRSAAQAFVQQYGPAFGEPDPARDLTVDRSTPMAAGGQAVHYQQLESGVPVIAGELTVQVATGGKVRSAAGELTTGDAVDVTPTVAAEDAAASAVDRVAADAGVDPAVLAAGAPALWVYDPSLLDEAGPRRLVWRIEVSSDVEPIRVEVLVDAGTGEVVTTFERVMEAKNRQICDNNNVVGASYTCPGAGVVRSEGGPASAVTDVNRAYELSGATYDFYFSRFARDSINGAGMTLYSTVRHCPDSLNCPYVNAFWDGAQMVYGDGFAGADDVVGHELTHGVTENESGLIYQGQSGAINESLSDIFGEFVDLTYDSAFDNDAPANRWQMGEDLPPSIGVIRDMEDPTIFGHPDRMLSPNFYNGTGDNGGVHTNSGVGNKAAFLITDGQVFNGQTVTGIGITKTARIFYEVNTNILTSGSNYSALGNGLNQACNNLVGVDGITAADCTQVAKAVTATEMIQPPPANDDFANATTISGTTGTTTGSTSLATRQTGEPEPGYGPSASIWFKFTAAGTGAASINTCNSNFDTLVGVYTGSAVNALTMITTNDDGSGLTCSGSQYWSKVEFNATQGATYYVMVDGYGGAKGAVTLNWTLPAPASPTGVSGTVTETGTGTPVGGAMVAVLKSSDFSVAGGGVADGSGNYSAQVPAGSYYLYVIDPSGTHAAGFFGAPTLVTVVNGTMVDKDPTVASSRGTIAGTVRQDAPVTAIGGAYALALNSSNGAPESLVVANGSGQYSLPGLAVRGHWVVHLDPTGGHRSEFYPDATDAAGATSVPVTAGGTAAVDGSLATQAVEASGSAVTGTIRDSVTNAPISGAAVLALRASDFRLARATRTDASGNYSLSLSAGSGYKLAFIDSAGVHAMEWHQNQPGSGLGTATTVVAPAASVNAALDPTTGSIGGTVTDDVSAAAVPSAWVLAIGGSGPVAGTVAAANGTYTIAGLPAGTYRVAFLDPLGGHTLEYHLNSPDFAGATPVNVTGGATTTVNAAVHHP